MDRLTDDLANYTNLEPMKNDEIFAVLKTDVPAVSANLILLNPETNEEKTIAVDINPNNYEPIGWNDSNGPQPLTKGLDKQLTIDNGQLFVWSIKTGEEPGLACSDYPDPNIQPQPPIDHRVRKKIIEIYVYCTENDTTFDLGEYETVKDSRLSIAKYNDQDHIFYSKYLSNHSDIYAIPIVEEQRNVFGYSGDVADTGVVVTDSDERSHLLTLKYEIITDFFQNPHNDFVTFEPVIRYLYAGREYNVETGDYYYRARVMDASVGRFGSKDLILFLNRYNYVANNPLYFIDIFGNAYFAKIGLTGGEYDLSDEGSSADQRNLQWVHEGIIWDTGRISGYKWLLEYDENYADNWWLGNARYAQNYTQIGEWYDDDLLQQAVDIVNDTLNNLGMDYDLLNFNCQDWSDLVRMAYDIIAGD